MRGYLTKSILVEARHFSEFAAWSLTNLAGMPINEYCPICRKCKDWDKERSKIVDAVRNSAYHIIDYKGATYFAIGLALVRIVEAILRNQKSVLTVSTVLDGEYGLEDVCLSVPAIVSQGGMESIMQVKLSSNELEALSKSASVLRGAIAELKQSG